MSPYQFRFGRICIAVTALLGFAMSASAQPAVGIKLSALHKTKVTIAGVVKEQLREFDKLLPGEEVTYVVHCANRGTEAASGVIVTLPIPPEMTLVAGSPDESVGRVDYSVDGGTTFGDLADLSVVRDGTSRAATFADINLVRWRLARPIPPDSEVQARCRALLK